MDPESKHLLGEVHALAKDNHHLLRVIRRHQLIGAFWKFAVWLILLALAFFGYQQYLRPLAETFSSATQTTPSGLFGLPTSADIQKLINSFQRK